MKAAEGYSSIEEFLTILKECSMIITKTVIGYYHNNQDSSITATKLCLFLETDAKMFINSLKLHEALDLHPNDIPVKNSMVAKEDKKLKNKKVDGKEKKLNGQVEKMHNEKKNKSFKSILKLAKPKTGYRNDAAFNLAKTLQDRRLCLQTVDL